MKAYITKYALTDGITEVDDAQSTHCPTMIRVPSLGHHACFHKQEWHTSKEAATAKAESMQTAKIASLKKSIAKLEKLTFQP